MDEFRDSVHLQKIRKLLWTGHPLGNAAVMVGSGFSRNAQPISGSDGPFPLWFDLARSLATELQAAISASTTKSVDELAATDPLALAYQYELTFGRTALDRLVVESVPDERYRPGELHNKLLQLPWRDVFTTNYDTLLERTAQDIHGVDYEVVLSARDLPGSSSPRIVKLHGSFPSHRPFIVTEEDFRRYPSEFAPFVNSVQQSMMENAFCLLGFSGEDPNFRSWLGWVRDNLGTSAPRVYVCGVLEFSELERRAWDKRNVSVVDVAPLFPASQFEDRHRAATEWLLEYLGSGEPADIKDWPAPAAPPQEKKYEGRLSIPPNPDKLPTHDLRNPPHEVVDGVPRQTVDSKTLSKVTAYWKATREAYPGWVVAPKPSRDRIVSRTTSWIRPVLQNTGAFSELQLFRFLAEVVWRFDCGLNPLGPELRETIEDCLHQYNPFDTESGGSRADKIAWLQMALALLREAREDREDQRFQKELDRLREVPTNWSSSIQVRVAYERCLFLLPTGDFAEVSSILEDFPHHPDPFWQVRKATVWEALEEHDRSLQAVNVALIRIRNATRAASRRPDYYHLSREGWALLQLVGLYGFDKVDQRRRINDRLEKLEPFRCNPKRLIQDAVKDVETASQRPRGHTKRKRFDLFSYSSSENWSSPASITAYQLFRLLDQGGVNPRFMSRGVRSAGAVLFGAQEAKTAWSYLVRLTSTKEQDLDQWLGQAELSLLPWADVDYVFQQTLTRSKSLLATVLHREEGGTAWGNICSKLARTIEMLSRLAVVLPDSHRRALFAHLLELFAFFERSGSNVSLADPVNHLCRRLLTSLSDVELARELPRLLGLPLSVGSATAPVREPFTYMNSHIRIETSDPIDIADQAVHLLNASTRFSDNDDRRKNALLRLYHLHRWDLLSAEQQTKFGASLWLDSEPRSTLPKIAGILNMALLNCPSPDTVDVKQRLRLELHETQNEILQAFHSGKTRRRPDSESLTRWLNFLSEISSDSRPLLFAGKEIASDSFICWEPDEVVGFSETLETWWQTYEEALKSDGEDLFWNQDLRIDICVRIARTVRHMVFSVSGSNKVFPQSLQNLFSDWRESGLPFYSLAGVFVAADNMTLDQADAYVRSGLDSTDFRDAREAIFGVVIWMMLATRELASAPKDELVDLLFQHLRIRRELALTYLLRELRTVVEDLPEFLTSERITSALSGLKYLEVETRLERGMLEHGVSGDQRIECRLEAIKLASSFTRHFREQIGGEIPESLHEWEEKSQTANLRRLRLAWGE